MKIIFLLFSVCCLFSQKNLAQHQKKCDTIFEFNKNIKADNKFEIWKIDSIQSIYIIYAKRRDSIIKIVSKMEKTNQCRLIYKGQFYDLKVESFLKQIISKRHIGGVKYNGLIVKLEGGDIVWDIFTCANLKGLCFISNAIIHKSKQSALRIKQ